VTRSLAIKGSGRLIFITKSTTLTADARPLKERSSEIVSFISKELEIRLGYRFTFCFEFTKTFASSLIMDAEKRILDMFRERGALLEGHFILSSGRHSREYLQCAKALEFPADANALGREIAELFVDQDIETVASPAIGGLVIGYAVASAMNVRFLWTERQNAEMTLRRGFELRRKERILVVEDVITTGGSTRECIAELERNGANVVAAASIIDRSNGRADVGVRRKALVKMDVESFLPEDCPMCAEGLPAVKPGSRTIVA